MFFKIAAEGDGLHHAKDKNIVSMLADTNLDEFKVSESLCFFSDGNQLRKFMYYDRR